MDETAAGESDEIALLLRPLRQRERPLAGPSDLEDFLAGEDHTAVDDADDERGQLRRRHRHHGLVEERKTFDDAPLLSGACGPGRADSARRGRGRQSARRLRRPAPATAAAASNSPAASCRKTSGMSRYPCSEPTSDDSLVEEPLCAPEPAAGRTDRASVGEIHADPACGTHRAQRLASLEIPVVGALEDADRVVVSTQHQRRRCQELEILCLERTSLDRRARTCRTLRATQSCRTLYERVRARRQLFFERIRSWRGPAAIVAPQALGRQQRPALAAALARQTRRITSSAVPRPGL